MAASALPTSTNVSMPRAIVRSWVLERLLLGGGEGECGSSSRHAARLPFCCLACSPRSAASVSPVAALRLAVVIRNRCAWRAIEIDHRAEDGQAAGNDNLVQVLPGDRRHHLVDDQALRVVLHCRRTVGARPRGCVLEQLGIQQRGGREGAAHP